MRSRSNSELDVTLGKRRGPVAQLVEHLDGIQGAAGSSPARSTELLGFTLAGFVAGEGYFSVLRTTRIHTNGDPVKQFLFAVTVRSSDVGMLETLRDFVGAGWIRHDPRRRANWKPLSTYSIKSLKAHQEATIPFADRYLLPCAKRDQFEAWRNALEEYVERHHVRWGRGPSSCRIDGCERPVRGRGLCRSHYYRETGW